jgi:hypothetical protein
MITTSRLVVAAIVGLTASQAVAKSIDILDDTARARAVAALRNHGQEGLDVALELHDNLVKEHTRLQQHERRLTLPAHPKSAVAPKKGGKSTSPHVNLATIQGQMADVTARLARWREAIDAIGGQRTCVVSRLYWFTDLAAAQAEAKRTGRPILSLRMLGKLTDEFSCANSRFFRTALYSNSEISKYLRENYVLHWQSVRPVPRVTIDFGDGRKLERTLTGNSAHYVLTSGGQPLDVLPGLYSPHAFRAWLGQMQRLHSEVTDTHESKQSDQLAAYHRDRQRQVYRSWAKDVERLGTEHAALVSSRIDRAIELTTAKKSDTPLAKAAARLAITKVRVEAPLLRFANFDGPWVEAGMDDDLWQAVANLHREGVKLDRTSIEVMRGEFPQAAAAARQAVSKSIQEDPVLRMVRLFENSIALDTVRNEYLLHRRIHEQFAQGAAVTADVGALNEWVYAELFLTPSNDPWLGLAPPNVYTALENDGRTEEPSAIANRSGG